VTKGNRKGKSCNFKRRKKTWSALKCHSDDKRPDLVNKKEEEVYHLSSHPVSFHLNHHFSNLNLFIFDARFRTAVAVSRTKMNQQKYCNALKAPSPRSYFRFTLLFQRVLGVWQKW